MKLFSHKRFLRPLTLSMASVALAAAVLLTGCGGSDGGGSSGGGASPKPNPSTPTQPEEPEQPETPEETEQKEVAAPGEEVKTENATMKVEQEDITAKIEKDEENADTVYAPFTFSIQNTSDEPIDLKETLTAQQKARSAIAVFAADSASGTSLKDAFTGGVASENLTVTLNGTEVPARVAIKVYNAAGVEKGGTILEEQGWYAKFDVVAAVPASWAESTNEEALKVDYNLPAEKETETPIKASFAVTKTGEAPKVTLEFESETGNYVRFDGYYMVTRFVRITNTSTAGTADISKFMSYDENMAMSEAINARATELSAGTNKYSDLVKASSVAMKEAYHNSKYTDNGIVLSDKNVTCAASINQVRRKYLNPSESIRVQVSVYIETPTDVTASFNGEKMFTIAASELSDENLEKENKEHNNVIDMRNGNYPKQKFPIPMNLSDENLQVKRDILDEEEGFLFVMPVSVANATENDYDTRNTLTGLGVTPDTITAQKVMKGNPAQTITAKAILSNGEVKENLPVVAAKATGMDSNLTVDEIDTVYAFVFVPADESVDWAEVDFAMAGIGTYPVTNKNMNMKPEKGIVSMESADELTKSAFPSGYWLRQEYTMTNISSYAIDLDNFQPVSASPECAQYLQDRMTYWTQQGKNQYYAADKAVQEMFYKYQNAVFKPTYIDGTGGVSCIAARTTEINYLYPGQSTKIAVMIYTQETPTLDWYYNGVKVFETKKSDYPDAWVGEPDTSESTETNLAWTAPNTSSKNDFYSVETTLQYTSGPEEESVVLGRCGVTNNGTTAVTLDNVITTSEYEELLNKWKTTLKEKYPNDSDDEILAKSICNIFVQEGSKYQGSTVLARTAEGKYYTTILVADQKTIEPGKRVEVSVLAMLPKSGTTVTYFYKGTSFSTAIPYTGTAAQSMLSRFASLLRPVK